MPRPPAPGAVNDRAIDPFTLLHAASGYLARRRGVPMGTIALFATLWELVEDELKDAAPGVFPDATADSKANSLTDVLATLVGAMIARPP